MRILSLVTFALLSLAVLAPSRSDAREIVRFNGYSAGTIVVK